MLFSAIAFFTTACALAEPNTVSCDTQSPYPSAAQRLPGYEFKKDTSGYVAGRIAKNAAVEAFDFQAQTLLQSGHALRYYPQYAATVVLAIDRDLTGALISGWNDLRNAGERVAFQSGGVDFRCQFAALSYGLSGESFSLDEALSLLECLSEKGLLCAQRTAPVWICFDYEAAAEIKAGRNIEIVVPKEGTLSFECGLLSKNALVLPEQAEKLIQYGLRMTAGACDGALYPDSAAYSPARTLADSTRMNTAMENAYARYRREALHTRRLSTADGREHTLAAMATILLVIAWGGSMIGRTLNKRLRALVLLAALQMTLWLLLRMIKWQLPDGGALSRYCWYAYYVFQLGLPATLLRMTDVIGAKEGTATVSVWRWSCLAVNVMLLLLVFTNDLHMWVFKLKPSALNWNGDYSYGFGYVLLLSFIVLCVFSAIALLIKKCWNSPRKYGLIFPLGFSLLLVSYGVLYALRVPFAWESDFTVTAVLFVLLFMESAMQTGLIPVNSKYKELFVNSRLDMAIVTPKGVPVLCSTHAAPLPTSALSQDYSHPFRVYAEPDLRVSAMPISGGAVVWREELSAVHALQKKLSQVVESLARSNQLLKNEKDVRERTEALRAKQRIYDELDAAIQKELLRIADILRANCALELDNAKTAELCLRLCYCKRSSNLIFAKLQRASLSAQEFKAYLEELAQVA